MEGTTGKGEDASRNNTACNALNTVSREENGDGGDGEGAGNEEHYDQAEDYYDGEGQGSQLQESA